MAQYIVPGGGFVLIESGTAAQWIAFGVVVVEEASGPAGQFARPTSDVADGAWLPSTGSDLYAMIDEASASDADYVYSETNNDVARIGMSALSTPAAGTRTIRYRARAPYGGSVKVSLYSGGSLVEEWTQALTTSFALYSHTLTQPVPNYGSLELRLTTVA